MQPVAHFFSFNLNFCLGVMCARHKQQRIQHETVYRYLKLCKNGTPCLYLRWIHQTGILNSQSASLPQISWHTFMWSPISPCQTWRRKSVQPLLRFLSGWQGKPQRYCCSVRSFYQICPLGCLACYIGAWWLAVNKGTLLK